MHRHTRTALCLAAIVLATVILASAALSTLTHFFRAVARARQDLMVP